MSESDPGLRRVSVHAGTAVIDLALPAGMPVATLLPPIIDTLKAHGISDPIAKRYLLSVPGVATLDPSTTLAQCGISDGDVLLLSASATPPPAFRYDDVAEAVSETIDGRAGTPSQSYRATRLAAALASGCLTTVGCMVVVRNTLTTNAIGGLGSTAEIAALVAFVAVMLAALANRAYRDAMAALTLSLVATAFSASAGFLAVPGIPGLPNMLLAAAAAAVTAVLARRVSDCGAVALTAVSCFATVVAVAAFAGTLTGVPLRSVGAVSALVSLGLLGASPRAAVVLAGLSPKLADPNTAADDLAARAIRADAWLASLLAAFSSSAAAGAIVTVAAGTPQIGCTALAAATAALLLLRANSVDSKRALAGVIGAVATVATTFGVAALKAPERGPWIAAATALLVAAAIYLGFVAPGMSLSPITRKSLELLECVVLIAMVPLTCLICGLYGAARGMHPAWS